jgi:phage FluMu gp28-like protein
MLFDALGQPIPSSGAAIQTGQDVLARYKKIATDPWEFCVSCVFTKDEVDKKNSIKRFPSHYEYLHYYVRIWERERLIIVPKSRRMFMSWVNIALYTWDTLFGLNRFNVFQSKKEEDSDGLVERAKFIIDNIPEDQIPKDLLPQYTKTYCSLAFKEYGSEIRGFAQGADQLRQYTCSGLLLDEFAFWDKAEETYSAAMPTIEGGGRCTILSSAGPGFMKRIVFDQLDFGSEDEHDGTDIEDIL